MEDAKTAAWRKRRFRTMKTLSLGALCALAFCLIPSAHAVELVKNGGFETGPQYNADFWTKPDLGIDPTSGEANNYARVGNYGGPNGQVGIDPGGYLGGPHGSNNGTGTQILTRTAWLGGLNPRTSIIQQAIDTSGFAGGAASLTFKVVYEDEDLAGRDFVYVDFGGQRIKTIDMGAAYQNWVAPNGVVRQGGPHFWTLETPTIDLSPYLDGTTKNLTFTVINDANSTYGSSSAWFDNVSIQAQPVPEPATLVAFATGGLVFVRRRRHRA